MSTTTGITWASLAAALTADATAAFSFSYEILDSGILVDEKEGLLALQQRIQPEAKERAAALLKRPDIIPRSEAALRGFLQPILNQQADDGPPPTITFKYR